MDNSAISQGQELGQIARLMFKKAITIFCIALTFDLVAWIGSLFLGIFPNALEGRLWYAFAGVVLVGAAYGLRLWFEEIYDRAESMRRQSVVSRGLGWKVPSFEFSDFRRDAGSSILEQLKSEKEDPGYFATKANPEPQCLGEMTIESIFWTKYLYGKMYFFTKIVLMIAIAVFIILLVLAVSNNVSEGQRYHIASVAFVVLPLIIAFNLVGVTVRLHSSINALRQVEQKLDNLLKRESYSAAEVLWLASEYNCRKANRVPIPNFIYKRYWNEINNEWNRRCD